MSLNDQLKSEYYDKNVINYSTSDKSSNRIRRTLILAKELRLQFPKNLLELGVGTGRYLKPFDGLPVETFGIDISKKLLEVAKKNCPNSELLVGSINQMPYEKNKFEMINCLYVSEHVLFTDELILHISSLLKQGGSLNVTFKKYNLSFKGFRRWLGKIRMFISLFLGSLNFPNHLNKIIIPSGHLHYLFFLIEERFERLDFKLKKVYDFDKACYLFCFEKL